MARSIRNMAVIALVLVSTGTASFAQRPQQARYTSPYGPTLPLQLNYFRQDNGVLDPYNAWVNPTNQLQSRLRGIENRQVYDEKATQSAFKKLAWETLQKLGCKRIAGADKAVVRANDDDIEALVNKSLGSSATSGKEVK